jgi:hypothetical protein
MNIKNISFKRKNIVLILVIILVLVLVGLVLSRGLRGHSLKIWNRDSSGEVDIANSKDYSKFEGKVESFFEGPQSVEFSFLHHNDNKVVQGKASQSKWFMIFDKNGNNSVTLYFTYEGARGWSVDDYIQEVIDKNMADIKVQEVKLASGTASTTKYVVNEKDNTEYYVSSIKGVNGEPWLAIVENTKANSSSSQIIAKDTIRSLKVK